MAHRLPLADADTPETQGTREDTVRWYHQRTKHHFHGFAAALGYLDWATQPDPFRRFPGSRLVQLELPAPGADVPYWQLFVPGVIAPAPLSAGSVSRFLRFALSLTAWKEIQGSRWALRANPSSGNLHPTEGYLVLPALAGIDEQATVCHYAPREHALEVRAELDEGAWRAIAGGLPPGTFLAGLTSILWREAWKYGERAFRYCQHDLGHALGSLRLAACALGWSARLADVSDGAIARLLGVDRDDDFAGDEREWPEALLVVSPGAAAPALAMPEAPAGIRFHGAANRLSAEHVADWPAIDRIAEATVRGDSGVIAADFATFPTEGLRFAAPVRSGQKDAEAAILGRRSAVAMDGRTSIPAASLFRMLARTLPGPGNDAPPFDVIGWRPLVHLGLFVHRVDGLAPGLYALARDPARIEALRAAMDPAFAWEAPASRPPGLALFRLASGDQQAAAERLCCDQEIAGAGSFALAMIAELERGLRAHGAWFYRRLFWECGLVGQVLYLEAEEEGVRSTGIGCYYDDPTHRAFGLETGDLQSLYHFTVGGPLEDFRLTTREAYGSGLR